VLVRVKSLWGTPPLSKSRFCLQRITLRNRIRELLSLSLSLFSIHLSLFYISLSFLSLLSLSSLSLSSLSSLPFSLLSLSLLSSHGSSSSGTPDKITTVSGTLKPYQEQSKRIVFFFQKKIEPNFAHKTSNHHRLVVVNFNKIVRDFESDASLKLQMSLRVKCCMVTVLFVPF